MSGHSKWHSIKHKKASADAKRGKIFTKIIKEITIGAKMGGGDQETNPRLRLAIQKAKEANMPNDNIDRAIKKGTGELAGVNYEEIVYEGYGPDGIAIIIDVLSDNRNRIVAELRKILSKNGGNLGENGSVAWMFEKKGMLMLEASKYSEDEVMEIALEAGALDIESSDEYITIYTTIEEFETVKNALTEKNISLVEAEIARIPTNTIELSGDKEERIMNLLEQLEDNDDVQNISSNLG